jgi:ADP-ribosylglycohydrolase
VKRNSAKDIIIEDLYNIIGAGVQVSETVPTCLALFKLTEGDVIEAVQLATNLGGDCDTIAAIVGSMCGAYSGADKIPTDWTDLLEKVNHYDFEKYTNELFEIIYQN